MRPPCLALHDLARGTAASDNVPGGLRDLVWHAACRVSPALGAAAGGAAVVGLASSVTWIAPHPAFALAAACLGALPGLWLITLSGRHDIRMRTTPPPEALSRDEIRQRCEAFADELAALIGASGAPSSFGASGAPGSFGASGAPETCCAVVFLKPWPRAAPRLRVFLRHDIYPGAAVFVPLDLRCAGLRELAAAHFGTGVAAPDAWQVAMIIGMEARHIASLRQTRAIPSAAGITCAGQARRVPAHRRQVLMRTPMRAQVRPRMD